jgi:tetratricopeptide (TPR) repeat protein
MALNGKPADRDNQSSTTRSWARAIAGEAWLLGLVFTSALAVRLIYLVESSKGLLFSVGGLDSVGYQLRAVGFADGSWPAEAAFFWAPGYSFFLGLLYTLFGDSTVVVKIIQMIIGSLSCCLVFLIARMVFEDRIIAVVSALICCLYGPLIYFDGQIVTANLDVFLQLSLIAFLLLYKKTQRWAWVPLAGLAAGLSAVNRGGVLLFVPLALIWLHRCGAERKLNRSLLAGALFVLPIVMLLMPVSIHNLENDVASSPRSHLPENSPERRISLISYNLGINLYLGNSWADRDVIQATHPLCFIHYKMIFDEPVYEGVPTYSGRSKYLVRKTLRQIVSSPLDWLKRIGLKLFRLINGAEIPRNTDIYVERNYSWVLTALLWKRGLAFPAGLLIPLALSGLVLAWKQRNDHMLLLFALFAQAGFALIFFVTSRYRLPMIPLLAVYAGYALRVLYLRWTREGARGLRVVAVLLVGTFILSNLSVGKMSSNHHPFEYTHLGNVYRSKGEAEKAHDFYQQALDVDPTYASAHFSLAFLNRRKGDNYRAIDHLRRGLEVAPMDPVSNRLLGRLLAERGELEKAAIYYREALKHAPKFSLAQLELAQVNRRLGRLVEATVQYEELLAGSPNDIQARYELALVYHQRKMFKEAIDQLEKVIEIQPEHQKARSALQLVLEKSVTAE